MFDINFLNELRAFETDKVIKLIPPKTKTILEIGGGTGEQARILTSHGFSVTSVDVQDSNYSTHKVFPITVYDGQNLPFEDNSFDFIFSSNVLEHVKDIGPFHEEMLRVLKPGKQCLHIMPTGSWTFWTSLAHFADMPCRLRQQLKSEGRKNAHQQKSRENNNIFKLFTLDPIIQLIGNAKYLFHRNKGYFFPKRHGERYFLLAEVFSFSPLVWRLFFWKAGAKIRVIPTRLFYTGYMVFGKLLSFRVRRWLSYILGDAVKIYIVIGPKRDKS